MPRLRIFNSTSMTSDQNCMIGVQHQNACIYFRWAVSAAGTVLLSVSIMRNFLCVVMWTLCSVLYRMSYNFVLCDIIKVLLHIVGQLSS